MSQVVLPRLAPHLVDAESEYLPGPAPNSPSPIMRDVVKPKPHQAAARNDPFAHPSVIAKSVVHPPEIPANTSLLRGFLFYVNHVVLLTIFFFVLFIRICTFSLRRSALKYRSLVYYPLKLPQVIRRDVNKLSKIPKHVSCILDLKDIDDENGGGDGLMGEISEIAAWLLSSGIPRLSIYERTGLIPKHHHAYCAILMRMLRKNMCTYFGTDAVPLFLVVIPSAGVVVYLDPELGREEAGEPDLVISLLCREDGKPAIVELARHMCDEVKNHELRPTDISVELMDRELVNMVGPEADLLISFAPALDLQDYPPWHIRLLEIYWEADNTEVSYAVFIRALQKYAHCKVNVGK